MLTCKGIATLLLPHQIPAGRWSRALVTDRRTLAVVHIDLSYPVPLSRFLKYIIFQILFPTSNSKSYERSLLCS